MKNKVKDLISSLAELGVSSLVFLLLMANSGFGLLAAIDAAFVLFAPAGILGILMTPVAIATMGAVGLDYCIYLLVQALIEKGQSMDSIELEIEGEPLPTAVKMRMKNTLDRIMKDETAHNPEKTSIEPDKVIDAMIAEVQSVPVEDSKKKSDTAADKPAAPKAVDPEVSSGK